MIEMTTTEKKSATTSAAVTVFAGLMTARHAGREISRTAFGMRTSNRKQSKMIEYDNSKTN